MPTPLAPAGRLTAVLTPALWVLAAPAAAVGTTPEGWDVGESVSTLESLLIFGGIPLALFAIIVLLTVAPSIARGSRPEVDRWATPQWFNGPQAAAVTATSSTGQRALPAVSTRALPRDRSLGSSAASPGPGVPAEGDVLAAAATPGGGASARW